MALSLRVMVKVVMPALVLLVTLNVLAAQAEYERVGFYPNVVFSCGALLRGDTIHMYYGAADRVIGLAAASCQDVLDAMEWL